MATAPLRVLGRIRLSRVTDESTSIERQEKAIEKWIGQEGHTFVDWAKDEDLSRSVDPFKAPELGKWLTDPELIDQWDVLAVWRMDRLGSGVAMISNMLKWCGEHHKTLYSCEEKLDLATPMGRMMVTIIAMIAEMELATITERINGSRVELRSTGRWPGGNPRYGYRAVQLAEGGWKLEHDKDALKVVNRIIDAFLEGKPLESICADLNRDHVLSPIEHHRQRAFQDAYKAKVAYTGRIPANTPWHPTTLQKLLPSRGLLGEVVHNGVTERDRNGDPVTFGPPLISAQKFDQVQGELERRKGTKVQRDRNTGMLLDVAKCRECGSNLHHRTHYKKPRADGSPGKVYRYYYCPNKHTGHISAPQLEATVGFQFVQLVGKYPRMRRVYVPATDTTQQKVEAERALDELLKSQAAMTSDSGKKLVSAQITAQDAKIAALEQIPQSPARTELRPVGGTYGEEWAQRDSVERRNLLRESGITYLTMGRTPESEALFSLSVRVPEDLQARLNLPEDPEVVRRAYWKSPEGLAASNALMAELDLLRDGTMPEAGDPEPLPPLVMAQGTDWSRYGECPTCSQGPGHGCIRIETGKRASTSNRYDRYISKPHKDRPRLAGDGPGEGGAGA